MSAVAGAVRRALIQAPKAARSVHTSEAKLAGGHGHSSGGYDDYLHAEHMYNITAMKNRKLKWALATIGLAAGGFGIPIAALNFQQWKAKG